MAFRQRFKRALNAFAFAEEQRVEQPNIAYTVGPSSTSTPHLPRLRFYNDKTLISSIYTRIAIDVASVYLRHCKVDEYERYVDVIDSNLNACLNFEPNIDQGPRAFRQDLVTTLFDKGVAAIVPVDTIITEDPTSGYGLDILTLRVGEVVQWHPKHVTVNLYNEATGLREDVLLEKRHVAIVENPLYAVMNAPNSTLQRLTRKLQLLDVVDEQTSSGKLDIIIQLPYVIKSEARRQQAEQRRTDIEMQLKGSQYGIAYTDGTEKITQLNRPAENNLMGQVEYLVKMLYGQLGITEDVMNGTASEEVMIAYYNRTIKPILDSVIEAMQRAFIGRKGAAKQEKILYFRNPFELISLEKLAEIVDKFARNEVLSSNEIRGFMGIIPSKDPKADELRNSNMPHPEGTPSQLPVMQTPTGPAAAQFDEIIQEVLGDLSKELDSLTRT